MYNTETNTFTGKLCIKAKLRRSLRNLFVYIKKNGLQKFLTVAALLILYIFFCLAGRNFFTFDTFSLILRNSYFIGFLAIGVTFVIITGGIDLSIGSLSLFAAMVGGVLITNFKVPMWAVIIIVISAATFGGFINGFLISYFYLPPFIATLGMLMVTKGLSGIISKSQTIYYPTITDPQYGWFRVLFNATQSNFPSGFIMLAVFTIISIFVLTKTIVGRYIFALGSNEEAARLSGIKTNKWKIIAYTISGFFCGIGGLTFAASYSSISPGAGQGYEFDAIAAVVIGGTSLSGGVGSIVGTIIGVYIMSVLKVGLPSVGVEQFFQYFTIGIVVIIAVLIDVYRIKMSNKVKKADIKKERLEQLEEEIESFRIKIDYLLSDRSKDYSKEISEAKANINSLILEKKKLNKK
ncbi:ABC transporter permease [uncultured Brachyspira sp.]|uniref:ABC transporter permease subunit n=1 Tax=uncultured Brachyspira sp. TaxID=221953 RepID=UPI002635E9A8|nr:ABC transporter permease [uncultured Brachyspira sp.]